MTVETTDLAVLVDAGSAWSKAVLAARHGPRWRIVGGVGQPSAWGDEALVDALAARVVRHVDPRLAHRLGDRLRAAPRIESHTPRRPGRLALVAVSRQLSAPVLRRAAESAGWTVVEEATIDDGRPLADRLAALTIAEVDAWLLGGGFDGASSPQALEIAALAAAARGTAAQPVVWAGAADLADDVRRLFGGAVTVLANPVPNEGAERPAALRAHLEALLQNAGDARGSQRLTPVSYRRAITELARGADLRILGVDVGARYATWTVADADGEIDARVFADGGLAATALGETGAAAAVARDLDDSIDELMVADALQNIRARPATIPETHEDMAVAQAAARHQLGRIIADEPSAADVDLIVGSGRTIAAAPSLADAARTLVDGLRPVGVTQLAVDPSGGLGPLGSLDDGELRDGIALLHDDLLVPLGTAIVCRGGRAGQTAMRVTLEGDGEHVGDPIEVRTAELRVVPLPRGRVAEVAVELVGGVSLGTERRARRARARVTGGAVGLILDARDAPLQLPRRADDRRMVLSAWRDAWLPEPRPARTEARESRGLVG